jgi:SAM-dependent methyltransferase
MKDDVCELAPRACYDHLYCCTDLLWPAKPGRMVRRAAEHLSAGRALDLGCGDGKNLIFLERLGWHVDAVDISGLALAAAQRRLATEHMRLRGKLWRADAVHVKVHPESYDLVIAYGLYHCLDDERVLALQAVVSSCLRPGGLFAFAAFNDELPLPSTHFSMPVYLRARDHIFSIASGWQTCAHEVGTIRECHLPVLAEHEHSLTWALLRKPRL